MASPSQFEMVVKMTSLSPDSTCSENSTLQGDESYALNLIFRPESESNPETLQFFKDPVHPPDEQNWLENISPFKPGRNMRACSSISSQCKDVSDLTSKRKRLLQKQKEQKMVFENEESSVQMATALVNGLIHHGFEIEPPNQTPRIKGSNLDIQFFKPVRPVEEKQLIVDFHRELKRVQKV
ncbi:hypothetical protein Btru_074846 [Bulinus truncatus]|nr:hypothetical protein Btru_074846 [Bulinus truncatus]